MSAIAVTGAAGFVGRRVVADLGAAGHLVRPLDRQRFGEMTPASDWRPALRDIDAVVHLMARVHRLGEADAAAYHRDNVEVPLGLARQAAEMGVRRLVFVSSVKAMAERSAGRPLTEADAPKPEDDYGRSKLAAERALLEFGATSGLEVVVLRPVLIHGAGAKGNFRTLLRALQRGLPLPLGAVHNRRSLLGLGNFSDAIALCLTHPGAAGEVFLVADDEAVSTAELVRELGELLGKPARLLPVPAGLLRLGLRALGRSGMADRLLGDLEVDTTKLKRLGWAPRFTRTAGLAEMVAAYGVA